MLEEQLAKLDTLKYVAWDDFRRDLNDLEPLMSNIVIDALPFLLPNFVAAREIPGVLWVDVSMKRKGYGKY